MCPQIVLRLIGFSVGQSDSAVKQFSQVLPVRSFKKKLFFFHRRQQEQECILIAKARMYRLKKSPKNKGRSKTTFENDMPL